MRRVRLLAVLFGFLVSNLIFPLLVSANPTGSPQPFPYEHFYGFFPNFYEDDIHNLYFDDDDFLAEPPPEDALSLPLFAWHPDMMADYIIMRREEGLDMRGVVPQLTPLFGESYEWLNRHITMAVDTRIVAAKEAKARSIHFGYEVYYTPQLVSVIVQSTTTSVTSKNEAFSVNFRPDTGQLVNLTEAVGAGIAPLADKLLTDMVRKNPERYNATFNSATLQYQPFYLTDRQVVLIFDEFQLVATAEGIKEFVIELSQMSSVTISREEYHVQPGGYNLKMVPLRKICEGLGYDIGWDAGNARVMVYQDGVLIIEMEPGVNLYEVSDRKVRSLEAAPQSIASLYGYALYVPITFFDQILNWVTYTIDENESITFLSYKEFYEPVDLQAIDTYQPH